MSLTNPQVSWELDRVDNASVQSNGTTTVKQLSVGLRPSTHALVSLLAAATIAHTLSIETVEMAQGIEIATSEAWAELPSRRHLLSYDSDATGRAKLAWLKEAHFTQEARETRISRALRALAEPSPGFQLDKAMWKWIAQEKDIEDL